MKSKKLRSCIAQALADCVDRHGATCIGNWTGHDKSTIGRWGARLNRWDLEAVLDVVENDPACRHALVKFLDGIADTTRPMTAERAVMLVARDGSDLNTEIATCMMDQHIDATEAARLVTKIDKDMAQLTAAKCILTDEIAKNGGVV